MTALAASRFLDLPAMMALEHMRFTTRHRIEGTYGGRHQSRQRGGAGEFVDYREYSPGEDLRRMDWKVFARTGKSYIRMYQDETNLSCMLAIDVSNSMQFGGRPGKAQGSKLEYVQFLATAMAYVINRGQDQVGLGVLSDRLLSVLPPGGTSGHLARVQETIERLQTHPSTRLAPGLQSLFDHARGRGVLMLLSDFLVDDLEETFAAVRLFRHRRFEVVVLHVIHPDEERLPEGTAFRFEGLEDEGALNCSPADIRDDYQRRFAAHAGAVRSFALANGCDYRRVSTAVSYLQTLGGFLVERSG